MTWAQLGGMMLLTLALGCGVSEEALLRDLDDGNWGRICRDFEEGELYCDGGEWQRAEFNQRHAVT